jgi:hypothetical protein
MKASPGSGPSGTSTFSSSENQTAISYDALSAAEKRLTRPVQATIRSADWLDGGSGSFHDTITSRPLLELFLAPG